MADWSRVEKDLRWCLIEGGIRVEGRDVLYGSLEMADVKRGQSGFHNGFIISQRNEESVANFVACEREDGLKLFNLGRKVIGLPAVGPPATA